jgi:hypothetical protein
MYVCESFKNILKIVLSWNLRRIVLNALCQNPFSVFFKTLNEIKKDPKTICIILAQFTFPYSVLSPWGLILIWKLINTYFGYVWVYYVIDFELPQWSLQHIWHVYYDIGGFYKYLIDSHYEVWSSFPTWFNV